jgi:hypothetical protein
MKMKVLAFATNFLFLPSIALAVTAQPDNTPLIVIQADNDFQTALTASLIKKKVPVLVIEDSKKANYILRSASVYSKDESGAGTVAR